MQSIDFLAIGDIVTDAFIRLKDAEVKKCVNHEREELCLSFGDKVAYESVEEVRGVGNSANAAVSAARLGIPAALLAHVGKDYQGDACLEELRKNNVNTSLMGVHEGLPTNYHYVLWYDVERTILVKHTEFPYLLPPEMPVPKMIYLSSIGEDSFPMHEAIALYMQHHPETKLVFQPGTFQMKFGTEKLKELYARTYAFFCNVEEAQRILGTNEAAVGALMTSLHALGPKLVFVTDGIKGAYASDGNDQWFMPVYPHAPYERTGAGDAFSSTVAAALLLGMSVPEALRWGPVNAMSVTQYVGAQKGLLTKDKLKELLAEAPSDYEPRHLF